MTPIAEDFPGIAAAMRDQMPAVRPLDTTGALMVVDGRLFKTQHARFSAATWPPIEGAAPGYIEADVMLEAEYPHSLWCVDHMRTVVLTLPSGLSVLGSDLTLVRADYDGAVVSVRFEGFVTYGY